MRVVVVAEYYPRAADPVLGVWAHRQALAARDAGADVRVLVLHRPVPSRAALRSGDPRAPRRAAAPAAAHRARRAAGRLRAVRGPAAAAQLRIVGGVGRALARASRCGGCGGASPTTSCTRTTPRRPGDAVRRARPGAPLVISVHGGDVLSVARRSPAGARAVRGALGGARLVLANSGAIGDLVRRLGGRRVRVVHLGTDLPPPAPPDAGEPTARHGRPPGRAQAPRRRAARAVAAARVASAADVDRRRRRARAPAAGAPRRRARARPPRRASRGRWRTPMRSRPPGKAASSSCPASTRRSASPTSRRWRAGCRRSAAAASPGRRRSPRRAAGSASSPPGDPEALAAELRGLLDEPAWRRELGDAARATVEARVHLGGAAGGRRSPPTRRRVRDRRPPGPVRHQPRAAVPRRRVRGAARARATWSSR